MTLPILLTICALVLAGFGAAWLFLLPNLRGPGESAHEDVKVTNCQRTSTGYTASVLIHNPTDESRKYEVKVSFTRSDGSEISYALAVADDVKAGDYVGAEATDALRGTELLFGCEITKATRW
jgi:hypothetical protein